jgi:hypothetical protein
MKSIIRLLSDKKIILTIFLAVHLSGMIRLLLTGRESDHQNIPFEKLLLLKSGAFFIYALLAYFTLKDIKLVAWLMAAIIFLTGVVFTFAGVFRIEWHQYIVKAYFITSGIYFVFGSFLLIRKPVMKEGKF